MTKRIRSILFAGSFTFRDVIELYIEKEKTRINISEANKTSNMVLLYESLGMMGKINGALKRAYKYLSTGNLTFRTTLYNIDFNTTISGIPCGVHIDEYYPYVPSSHNDPGEEEAVTYTITDLKGYEADWLYKKLSIDEINYIESEALKLAKELYQNFDSRLY